MCVFFIFTLSGCIYKNNFYYENNKNQINIPILSLELTTPLDIKNIEKYDQDSLIPGKFTIGTEHQMVQNIQQRLMELGFMDEDKPSIYYSEDTASSVSKFQRQYDLNEDGVLSPELYNILMDKDAKSYEARLTHKGDDITMIQQRLYELSYMLNESDISGVFDEKTENAVKNMQSANKLSPTGTVDLKTYYLLYSDTAVAYTINNKSQNFVIEKYQKRLKELGYYLGEINGVYSELFRESVKSFQNNNSQIVNGWIGPSTKFLLDSNFAKPYIIHYGQKNKTVRQIQERLHDLKYLKEDLVTGAYGEFTAQGVAHFQKENSIEITGAVNGKTLEILFSENAKPAPKGYILNKKTFLMDVSDIKKYATENENVGTVDDLIRVAKMKLGTKYVWGAKGPNKFDCSGFVYWCLNQIGINIPYMTTYNWKFTTRFEKIESFDDLKTGDLVIVTGHMGIVCDDETVIDASSSNGKVIHRYLDDWWRKRFIVGYKLFNDVKDVE